MHLLFQKEGLIECSIPPTPPPTLSASNGHVVGVLGMNILSAMAADMELGREGAEGDLT